MSADLPPEQHNYIINSGQSIGQVLEHNYPAFDNGIQPEHVEEVADYITLVVAQILQAWLDAGSERDVTLEELGPHIEDHIRMWVHETK